MNPLGLVLLAMGLALFGGAWWAYSRRRHMADTPTSKARSMAVGKVELAGVAVPAPGHEAQRAPFTGTPCLYWEYEIEEERTRVVTRTVNGKTQTRTERYWARVDSDRSGARFGLRDETGVAVVDPRGADMPTPQVARFGSGFLQDPPPTLEAFLQARGVRHEGILGFNKTMRYTERRLHEGARLYVLGNASRPADAPADAVGNEALVVQKEGEAPFLVSDKSEEQLTMRWTLAFWGLLLGGIGLAAAGASLLGGA